MSSVRRIKESAPYCLTSKDKSRRSAPTFLCVDTYICQPVGLYVCLCDKCHFVNLSTCTGYHLFIYASLIIRSSFLPSSLYRSSLPHSLLPTLPLFQLSPPKIPPSLSIIAADLFFIKCVSLPPTSPSRSPPPSLLLFVLPPSIFHSSIQPIFIFHIPFEDR